MNILFWLWVYIFYTPTVLSFLSLCLHIAYVQSSIVMSVDLGSEMMKVSTVSAGKPIEIVLNERSKEITPSAIAFHKGVRAFGEEALTIGVYSPSNCYVYFLDLLGKTIENPVVDIFKTHFPYYHIFSDSKRNTVLFKNTELNEQFSPEELVAMMLEHARDLAQKSTEQVINEVVLSVPGYFGQAERFAILNAAKLAGLKVLQLINSYTAAALNYGTSLTKGFNESPIYMMFYDMGAYSTQVSVVSYQLVKSDKVAPEFQRQLTVLGVGYERNLGGLEIQIRLRDYLATKFNNLKLSSNDVTKNHQSMAKLFKEAGRLKKILSVNTDCFANIKGLIDSKDLHIQVTRKELEDMCKDIFDKAVLPAIRALKASGLTIKLIEQVVLVGAGTRVPMVQDYLVKDLKSNQSLNWYLNTNEAVVLGAAYKAADISNEFEMESFIINEANIFPMEVTFCEGVIDEIKSDKKMKQVLLDYMSSYPLSKTLTFAIFNKYQQNFNLSVNYAKLNNLEEKEINYLGSLSLSIIKLKLIHDIHSKLQGQEDLVDKRIEVNFSMDSNGILMLGNIELCTENTVIIGKKENLILSSENSVVRGQKEESILSMFINTINTLYKGLKKFVIDKLSIYKIIASSSTPVTIDLKNSKKVTIKEPIDVNYEKLFVLPVEGDDFQNLIIKLKKLKEKDIAQLRKEKSLDNLLILVTETRERLNQPEYAKAATDAETKSILDKCIEIANWLGYDGLDGETEEFDYYSNELKRAINPVWERTMEHLKRPIRLKELDSTLNSGKLLLDKIKKIPLKDTPFTLVEINNLEKSITEITSWRDKKVKEQEKLPKYVNPILTVQDIVMKDENIQHEMNNVKNKFKSWKSKNKDKDIVKDLNWQGEWSRKSREAENIVSYSNLIEPKLGGNNSEKSNVTYWIRDKLDSDIYLGLILIFLSILVLICLFAFVFIQFK